LPVAATTQRQCLPHFGFNLLLFSPNVHTILKNVNQFGYEMLNKRALRGQPVDRLVVDSTDTLANVLRRRLADEILNGDIGPGTKLDEQRIADRFGVSRTPVREAITQLGASGLVKVRPRRGAVVVPVEPAYLAQLYESVAHVEAICAQLAASRMTLIERMNLQRLFQDCAKALGDRDPDAFAANNRLFHNAIRDGAHNPPLGDAIKHCRRQIAPFTKATFRAAENMQATLDDYREILAAISDQEPETAGRLMKRHFNRVGMLVLRNFRSS